MKKGVKKSRGGSHQYSDPSGGGISYGFYSGKAEEDLYQPVVCG